MAQRPAPPTTIEVVVRDGGPLLIDCLDRLDRQLDVPVTGYVLRGDGVDESGIGEIVPNAGGWIPRSSSSPPDEDHGIVVTISEAHRVGPSFVRDVVAIAGEHGSVVARSNPVGFTSFGRAVAAVLALVAPSSAPRRSSAPPRAEVGEWSARSAGSSSPSSSSSATAITSDWLVPNTPGAAFALAREAARSGHPALALGPLLAGAALFTRRGRRVLVPVAVFSLGFVAVRAGRAGSVAPHRAVGAASVLAAGASVGSIEALRRVGSRPDAASE